eukprot:2084432-Amphidinium_carterae.1
MNKASKAYEMGASHHLFSCPGCADFTASVEAHCAGKTMEGYVPVLNLSHRCSIARSLLTAVGRSRTPRFQQRYVSVRERVDK